MFVSHGPSTHAMMQLFNFLQILGTQVWTVISNITEPLAILFYFHSVGCLADVIGHAFTGKYIGLMPEQSPRSMDDTDVDAPQTLVLVRSTSVHALYRQSSTTSGIFGHRNGGLSRLSSVNSRSSDFQQPLDNRHVSDET
jgi:hypothetical protein